MKKNNKGFFLVETVVIISLVTIIMAYVYPNVNKLYENYRYSSTIYDQTEDVYTLLAYKELLLNKPDLIKDIKINNNSLSKIDLDNNFGEIESLYLTKYINDPINISDYNFNRYLKRMKKTSNDIKAYRLVGVFDSGKRYASIKIDDFDDIEKINEYVINDEEYDLEDGDISTPNEDDNNDLETYCDEDDPDCSYEDDSWGDSDD